MYTCGMNMQNRRDRRREWLRRYIPAEIIATVFALVSAWTVYAHTHSFVAATAAGWVGEGIGFYGYFVALELAQNSRAYSGHSLFRRIWLAVTVASVNLFVEFLPAELLDNFIIRPYLMYLVPQHIHPYPVGFLVGKFSADILFYALAIVGYEARKRWLHR